MRAFFVPDPESVAASALIKARAVTSGFADSPCWSLNAVRFMAADGPIIAMLLIGAAMVTSLGDCHALVSLHRLLGIPIPAFALLRLADRPRPAPPPLPRSGLALAGHRFVRLGSCFIAGFFRRTGDHFGEIC